MPDATPQFKQQLKEAFNAIQDGQVFTFRRTFTVGDVALFCGVTGDYNPYHIDQTVLIMLCGLLYSYSPTSPTRLLIGIQNAMIRAEKLLKYIMLY